MDKKQPLNIVILVLENAGKTTLLRTLKGKQFTETYPTIGMNIEIFEKDGLTFQVIDVGGQMTFRENLWSHNTTLAKAVVFVFDIYDKQKKQEAKTWFEYIKSYLAEDATYVFLANKIDIKPTDEDFLSIEEIIQFFNLEKISSFPCKSIIFHFSSLESVFLTCFISHFPFY